MQWEHFGRGVHVSIRRGNGTGVGSAEKEGVALLEGGVAWAEGRAKQQQHNNKLISKAYENKRMKK